MLGSGFVGSAVAARLAQDRPVSVVDIPDHPELAERNDAARALILGFVESGVTAVVNTCGRLRGTDAQMTDANIDFPTWLVDVLAGSGVRFVHLGSAAEYGDPGSADPIPETHTVAPQGIYGESKWAGTAEVLEARAAGLDAVVARGFNLVSSKVAPVSPLYQFVTDVTKLPPEGGNVELWWPATFRDHIMLDDLAAGVAGLAVIQNVPDIVNICSGIGVRFDAIVRAIAREQGKPITITSLNKPGIPAVVGDNSRLRDLCGVHPEMSAKLIAAHVGV